MPAIAGLTRLSRLDLSGTRVTDAGLAALGELPALEVLSLDRTPIDGSGLGHLSHAHRLKALSLKRVHLRPDALRACEKLEVLRFIWMLRTFPQVVRGTAVHTVDIWLLGRICGWILAG